MKKSFFLNYRIFGLIVVIKIDCGKFWFVEFYEFLNWLLFVNLFFLLVFYISVVIEIRYWRNFKVFIKRV